MSSTDNPPSLTLSDIMYHMSPSPAPPDEHSGIAATTHDFGSGDSPNDTFISSEVKSFQDVAGIRRRLTELGFSGVEQLNSTERSVDFVSNPHMSHRERELLDMVLSLAQAVSVDPSQLERQAETIANLTTHRDFLAGQIEEERERWESERESWDRTAEALLTQRNKPSKSEDIERLRGSYESENRMLRAKLQDSQKRQLSLESELTRLKPLLFLQPFMTPRQDKGKAREFVPKSNLVSIPEDTEMKETRDKTPYYHNYQSQPQSQSRIPNSPAAASTSKPISSTQTTPLPPRRSRDHSNYNKSFGKRHSQTLTSDAYTEHLLLAAKKIGRKRAAIVTGIMQHAEREKEALVYEQDQIRSQKEQEKMEQDRQERIASGAFGAYYRTGPEASTSTATSSPQRGGHTQTQSKTTTPVPRTPKRNNALHYSNMGTGSAGSISTHNMESSLVYVNVNTATSSYDSPWAGSGVMGTPGQIKSALNRQNGRAVANSEKSMGMGMTSNPTTPLASLLDAALMMNEDGRSGTTTKQRGKMNGKGRPLDEPESPVPKRRKTSSTNAGGKLAVAGGLGLDRVKSALDVLADQADQAAAAFTDTTDHQPDKRASITSNNEPEPNVKGKGKGKAKAIVHEPNLEDPAPAPPPPPDEQQIGPMTFGKELIFVTSNGRGRPRRDSTATTRGTGKAVPTAPTPSSRPVRQASSRKRATSPEDRNHNVVNASTSASGSTTTATTTTKGPGRARAGGAGRATRGSTSTSRSVAAAAPEIGNGNADSSGSILSDGTSRMISPPGGLRVITPAPGYSPLDEALAISKPKLKNKPDSRHNTPENPAKLHSPPSRSTLVSVSDPFLPPPPPPPSSSSSSHVPSQSSEKIVEPLRPASVMDWGIRSSPAVDEPDSSSPMRGIEQTSAPNPKDSENSTAGLPSSSRSPHDSAIQLDASSSNEHEPSMHVNGDEHEHIQTPTPTPATHDIDTSTAVVGDLDPDTQAEVDEDRDAEGDQEDGEGEDEVEDEDADAEAESEGEGEGVSAKHTSRSKSPPPPDPPPPGPDNGSPPDQQDDHDTDADAEGEMDLDEDAEDPAPPSSTGGGGAIGAATSSSFSFSSPSPGLSGWKMGIAPNNKHDSIDLATTFFSFMICVVTPPSLS